MLGLTGSDVRMAIRGIEQRTDVEIGGVVHFKSLR